MLVLVQIVAAHDGPRAALLHGRAEGGQIDFIERAVVHDDVRQVAVGFAVVQREVLHAGRHAVLLQPLDVGHHDAAGQVGILAHVLEVAAVERRAVNVHARAQDDVLAAVAGFFAQAFPVETGHVRIPRGSQAGQRGEGHARVVGPAGLVPLVPFHLGADAVGPVVGPEFGDAEAWHPGAAEFRLGVDHVDFLLKRHAPQRVLYPFLDGTAFVQVDGRLLGNGRKDEGQRNGKE